MEQFQLWLSLILGGMAVLTNIFLVYNHFRNPDIKASTRIDKIEATCPLKHEKIDETIKDIKTNMESLNRSLLLLKENDIKHIEMEMRDMSNTQTKILTILEYKEGKKI